MQPNRDAGGAVVREHPLPRRLLAQLRRVDGGLERKRQLALLPARAGNALRPWHEAELPEQRPPGAAEALAGAAGDERLERPLGQLRTLDEVGQAREGAVALALGDERLCVLLPHLGDAGQP